MKRRRYHSHGGSRPIRREFLRIGKHVIFEPGVLVFHPESIAIGNNVYVGHGTILKGYFKNRMQIGDNAWIGQNCFFHSAGGLTIGSDVGIGPGTIIITSEHEERGRSTPPLHSPLRFAPVQVEDQVDIGCGAIILPGTRIGKGSIIGAGAVLRGNMAPYSVAYRRTALVMRKRP